MRLDSVNNAVSAEFKKINKTDHKTGTTTYSRPLAKRDRASFSGEKGGGAAESKSVEARVRIEPEIRSGRVADVQEKIESGYYNSQEFTDKLADKLIKDFGF